VGYSVAVKFAVDILAAALGSTARDNDGERLSVHEVNALHKGVDKGLADSGELYAAADNGKNRLLFRSAVLFQLVFLIERPCVNGKGTALFQVLYTLTVSFGQLVDFLLVVGVDVGTNDVHNVSFLPV